MRLTIINADKTVYLNGKAHFNIDLSFLPNNLHAFQWRNSTGEIEWKDKPNDIVDSLPSWAEQAISLWNIKEEEELLSESNLNNNLSTEEKLASIREERDIRLAYTDWTQLLDVQALHGEEWRLSWSKYRQALRDLPNQSDLDLDNPDWPIPPQ